MKLRFKVNQAEAFRAGIDAPDSVCMIEVTPCDINPYIRGLIADRLDGIKVCKLGTKEMLIALAPNFDALFVAVNQDIPSPPQ